MYDGEQLPVILPLPVGLLPPVKLFVGVVEIDELLVKDNDPLGLQLVDIIPLLDKLSVCEDEMLVVSVGFAVGLLLIVQEDDRELLLLTVGIIVVLTDQLQLTEEAVILSDHVGDKERAAVGLGVKLGGVGL